MVFRCVFSMLICALISACASSPKSVTEQTQVNTSLPINYQLFPIEARQNPDDIFALSDAQQQEFSEKIELALKRGLPKHEALYQVIESKLSSFTYYGETLTAEQAIRLNRGNCMSLAIVTTAYAKFLGLDYSYREVSTLPIFEKKNDLILSSSHVKTVIYPEGKTRQDYLKGHVDAIVIDYFPNQGTRDGKRLKVSDFISFYYRNIAADALVEEELALAFNLAEQAYQHDKTSIEVINLLAVIHRRAGDLASAEAIYRAGLSFSEKSLPLLSNFIMLLESQQRFAEADKLQAQLDSLDDPNPYHWLEQAYIAQNEGDNRKAIIYYQKALTKAPYLHQAYKGLYQIYLQKGQRKKAKAMLTKALEWTYEIDERKQYKYKLYSLY